MIVNLYSRLPLLLLLVMEKDLMLLFFEGEWWDTWARVESQSEKYILLCFLLCLMVPILQQHSTHFWCPQFNVSSNKALSSRTIFFHAKACESYCPYNLCCIKIYMICFLSMMIGFLFDISHMPCSVFSRYGIHSFPAILLANRTVMVRYRGSKDLNSLVSFYKRTTGDSFVLF